MNKRWTFLVLMLGAALFASSPLMGAEIDPGDLDNPNIDDFNGLGLPFINATPIDISGHTFTTDDGTLRYTAFPGIYLVSGEAVGSNTDTGYLDVVFDTPLSAVGGWIGASEANVEFFNESDQLLGSVVVSGNASAAAFAGWDGEGDMIARMRVNDTETNGLIVILDDLTYGDLAPYVPVPALGMVGQLVLLLALALMGLVFVRTRTA